MSSKSKKRNTTPVERGVATSIHNTVLDQLKKARAENRLLQNILASLVHASDGTIFVDLVKIPGAWELNLEQAESPRTDVITLKLQLVRKGSDDD